MVAASQIPMYVIVTILYHRQVSDFDALAIPKCASALLPSIGVTMAAEVVPSAVLLWPGFLTSHLIVGFVMAAFGTGAGWIVGIIMVKHPLLVEIQHVTSKIHVMLAAFLCAEDDLGYRCPCSNNVCNVLSGRLSFLDVAMRLRLYTSFALSTTRMRCVMGMSFWYCGEGLMSGYERHRFAHTRVSTGLRSSCIQNSRV